MTWPTSIQIREAAQTLRHGGLVAFPTETVYGLGANAWDEAAVARIFELKGRPKTSPLIVHVPHAESARELVTHWPDSAQRLAERFWPGPLTLVLPKRAIIPDLVTAGLNSVGVRVPRHPVALELLREAAVPVAAPSANLFMRLSPTTREHVPFESVTVLEGGATEVGIESTVVSLVGTPRLLRPGAISRSELERVVGPVLMGAQGPSESPGLHAKHYQPRTPMLWAIQDLPSGQGAYLWLRQPKPAAHSVPMPSDAVQYAAVLYRLLHKLDTQALSWIAVEPLPESDEWAAVRDRLTRAIGN